ncbi:transposase [Rhizobium lusitanum]|uniref:Transposase n=1 Tax=Rhizobium lusitanum TaxID=293958 RepID=A0A6L9UH20_9HYPH|nr:transposase [Rhizobium lusitanum]NEI74934.1 transposase [Rhizobium lusitanum]
MAICHDFWPCRAVIGSQGHSRKAGLIISEDGIYIEINFDETIAWRSVRDIRRYQHKRADQMYVDLDPVVARTLTRRGLVRWLPKKLQGQATPAVISLKLLRADPDWIYSRCLEFLAKNRERQALLQGQIGKAVLADKAYDSNALREIIAAMGAQAVILSNRSRKVVVPDDALAYINRNRFERIFGRMRDFRRFATRYERSAIHLIAAMIWIW